jgi:hypothetical protein
MKNQGVSNVIGVILILGIMSLFLVTVRLEWVPEWQQQKEARMSEDAEIQLGRLASELQQQQDNPVSFPIDLTRPTSFWVPVQLPATLEFEPGTVGASLDMTLQQTSRNGAITLAAEPDWSPLASETGDELAWLRMRIPSPIDGGATATISFTDDSGLLGSIEVETVSSNLLFSLVVGGQTIDQDSYFTGGSPDYYIFDLLRELETGAILSNPEGDIQLDVVNNINGEFSWAFENDGILTSTAGPLLLWQPTFSGGTLQADLNHQEFQNQRFIIENGGIVLAQDDGSVVRSAAGLRIQPGAMYFAWSNMLGDAQTASESRTMSVSILQQGGKSMTGWTDALSYTLTTPYPLAWAAEISSQFEAAAILPAQYTVTANPTNVVVTYDGPLADATRDIYISWAQRDYRVELVM